MWAVYGHSRACVNREQFMRHSMEFLRDGRRGGVLASDGRNTSLENANDTREYMNTPEEIDVVVLDDDMKDDAGL